MRFGIVRGVALKFAVDDLERSRCDSESSRCDCSRLMILNVHGMILKVGGAIW